MFRFCKLAVLIFVGISVSGLTAELSADNKLRSAFLGPSVWEDGLSSQQVNLELREHFSEVITRLESKNASSLQMTPTDREQMELPETTLLFARTSSAGRFWCFLRILISSFNLNFQNR